MKKILSLTTLLAVLLTASCSLKEDFKGNDSESATLTFTIGEEGAATRAIGDGTTVNELIWAVYDEKGQNISDLNGEKSTSFPTQVKITLAKGQTYSIAFWAQNSAVNAYTFDPATHKITIDYAGVNNDEARDAFFKTVQHTVTGDIALDVTLERPFAQINLGVTKEDWDAAEIAGITVENSKVVIENAATSLDLFDGTVGGEAKVEYTLSAIPTEDLLADFDDNDIDEVYKYLSLSYILVNADNATFATESALVDAVFTLDNNKEDIEVKVNNLPVRRNWRTNVVGELLTGDIIFNIDVDPIFDGEENYPDTLEEELYFAGLNGGTVTLSEDVTLKYPIVVEGAMVVELNGHNITAPLFTESNGVIAEGDTDSYAFWVKEGGDLTINGEGVVKTQACKYSIAVWAQGGNVVINGGDYENAGEGSDLIYASAKGNVIINGGKFTACEKAAGVQGTAQPRSTLNLKDNTGSSIVVYGGSFYEFNPADNASEGPHTNFVADGYVSILSGEWYTVCLKSEVAIIDNTTNVDDLNDILNNSEVVVFEDSIDAGDYMEITGDGKDVVINMNGNTVTSGTQYDYGFIINGENNVVINGADIVSGGGGVAAVNGANVTFNGESVYVDTPSTSGRYLFYLEGDGSTLTINDGEFSWDPADNQKRAYVYAGTGTTVYINGGTFGKASTRSGYTAGILGSGTVIITGGTFGFDVTNWVADGYQAVKSGTTWTVSAK